MANNPTMVAHAANLLNALTYFHRNGQYPLDDTSLWNTIEEFEAYLTEPGSYRYPGQLVSVTNGDAYGGGDKDVSLVLVRPDGTMQKVGSELIFETTVAAEAYVTKNPEFAAAGKTLTVKSGDSYELYVIKPDKTLQRISFDATDIPEVTWEALTGKPASTPTDIDSSVNMTKRFSEADGVLSFDGAALAKQSDIPTTYDATKITGTIKVENLPQAALERLIVVANDAARKKITKEQAQNGDVVKVQDTGLMYYIKDDTKLSADGVADAQEGAFELFTAGAASSVPWSGVTGTPTTLSGYGITDGVNTADVHQTYTEDGKVVAWKRGTNGASSTQYDIEGKAKEACVADKATTADNAVKLGGQAASYYATATAVEALTGRVDTLETDTGELKTWKTSAEADLINLKNGSAITSIEASKINGVISEENLPDSVKERLTIVANDAARFQLTVATVQQGDIVKVTDGSKMYIVKDVENLGNEGGYEPIVAASAESVAWDKITGKPTTVAQSGLTDAVAKGDVSTVYAESKIVGWKRGTNANTSTEYDIEGKAKGACEADSAADAKKLGGQLPAYYATAQSVTDLDGKVTGIDTRVGTAESDIATIKSQIGTAAGTGILNEIKKLQSGETITALDAAKLTGTIDVERLPKAALERLYIASTANDLQTLTTEQVQNGDTVKIQDSGLMYFVKDETKLGNPTDYMQAFEAYTVGQASQVPWSGVTGKPTTLDGYGITDAVKNDMLVSTAAGNAGKVLVLNNEGKLDVDITGSVAWEKITGKPTSTATAIDQAVTAATHANREVLDKLSDMDGAVAYDGNKLAKQYDAESTNTTVTQLTNTVNQLKLGSLVIVNNAATELPDAAEGQLCLEIISG